MKNDNIIAVSTAIGESAIAVIRLSGENSIHIVNQVFRGKNLESAKSHTVHYGHIINSQTKQVIDEVMVSIYKSPKSYTTENMVEISCHGGYYAVNSILDLFLETKNVRLAEPGEFSKRAFLNGRIDLLQAESVMDIISAKTALSFDLAQKGLDGRISGMIQNLKNDLLAIIAQIEVNIDYPEYDDVETLTTESLLPQLYLLKEKIEHIIESSKTGRIIKDGLPTAIIGRPNVGKSSLLNLLLREEKAIVTSIAGTTRDTIEGYINIKGVALKLVDTAGIRETIDVVEKIGVDRALKSIEDAQLIILVLDNSAPLSDTDLKLLDLTKNKKRIIVINKIDINSNNNFDFIEDKLYLSTETLVGLQELEHKIAEYAGLSNYNSDSLLLSNIRHIEKLKESYSYLKESIQSLQEGLPVDLAEIDLKNVWFTLGEIIGQEAKEDLLDELFSRFCLGK